MQKNILIKNLLIVAVIICGNESKGQLLVQSGGNIVTVGNPSIVLNNIGLTNAGTITSSNGTIVFTGTSLAAATQLSSSSPLNNIQLSKTSGGVALAANTTVNSNVQLSGGVLDLNGFNLDLVTTGSLQGENALTYVTDVNGGEVLRTINLNNPVAADPGNIGLEITSTSNLGSTVIRRGHVQQVSFSGIGIGRYFDVQPANNLNLNATIKFKYQDAELAGIQENELNLFTSTDNGTSWQLQGVDGIDIINNTLTKNNIASFGRLTLGSAINNPLPVKLIGFTADLSANDVHLKWITSSEHNSRQFEVESSENAVDFTKFATVASTGNGTANRSYAVTDHAPLSGIRYYRLKQVDIDGSFEYSRIVSVNRGAYENKLLNVFPNPARGPVHIDFTSFKASVITLQVVNDQGRVITQKQVKVLAGFNDVIFDATSLSAGIYYIKVRGISSGSVRLIKINN